MDEFAFISELLSPLATHRGALELKDDAAILDVTLGKELVVTNDALVEGIHFIGNEQVGLIAQKALRTNLSDLAAMGATPYGYFMTLILPASVTQSWLKAFTIGLKDDQAAFGLSLLGGDTTRSPDTLSISITMLGLVPKGRALKRVGAKIGDAIYVSGSIGDGALGLQIAKQNLSTHSEDAAFLLHRYHLPAPRIALGEALRGVATSCMDISDGLAQDLGHLCKCSSIGAEIFWPQIPLSAAARATAHTPEMILTGGDDYELLFTAPEQAAEKLQTLSSQLNVPITRIGSITKDRVVRILDANGQNIKLTHTGYKHF